MDPPELIAGSGGGVEVFFLAVCLVRAPALILVLMRIRFMVGTDLLLFGSTVNLLWFSFR